MESITNFINTSQAPGPSDKPTGQAAELGRDEFLQLLVAKLENQDPLEPSKDTEFVAELATFSSLEQLINANGNLESIALSQGELINSQALTLIGKEALVESGNELRIKDGQPDKLVYVMPLPAQEASLTIVDSDGVPVHTIELDKVPNGRVTIDWDGTDSNGNPLEDGDYTIDVNVKDSNGEDMAIGLFRSLDIDGVSFLDGAFSLVSGDREIPFELILEIREG